MTCPPIKTTRPRLGTCQIHELDNCQKCSSDSELHVLPRVTYLPDVGMEDAEVASTEFYYSDRAPTDWVISGPLGSAGHGRGRAFRTWGAAEAWGRAFYGPRYKGRLPDEGVVSWGRWALLVRGPRGVVS